MNTTYKGRLDRDDLAMMDNMNFVLRQYPDDKFFGQLSNGHVPRVPGRTAIILPTTAVSACC